ncbi:hypothetical protein LCGC14_0498700 [marine sediment metagenome]|uniref:Uncharacterized protein n=1 Tax=marine sediment metagenome TaxID=412755 RepID=A0A0F9URK3_9ZZZZ
MKIIRDNEPYSINMLALLINWGIHRCNYRGCTNFPTTIISQVEGCDMFGLCEEHYQLCNTPGGGKLNLVWDNFDAFRQVEKVQP